jgi:ArsR family transcriptional regulator, arsenate/arsenite/antimonite-responsive transcriptional repressor
LLFADQAAMMGGCAGDDGVAGKPVAAQKAAMRTKPSPRISPAQAARTFQLLGAPVRLRILLLLANREEASVGAVSAGVGQSQTAVSHHLGLLRRGRVVEFRRDGRQNLYRISPGLVPDLLRLVRGD